MRSSGSSQTRSCRRPTTPTSPPRGGCPWPLPHHHPHPPAAAPHHYHHHPATAALHHHPHHPAAPPPHHHPHPHHPATAAPHHHHPHPPAAAPRQLPPLIPAAVVGKVGRGQQMQGWAWQ